MNGFLNVLNTALDFINVFNSGELNLLSTTISQDNNEFVVNIDTFFEEVFHGNNGSLVISNEFLSIFNGDLGFFNTLENVNIETSGGE